MNGRRLMILHKNKTAITLEMDTVMLKIQFPIMIFFGKTMRGLPNPQSMHKAIP